MVGTTQLASLDWSSDFRASLEAACSAANLRPSFREPPDTGATISFRLPSGLVAQVDVSPAPGGAVLSTRIPGEIPVGDFVPEALADVLLIDNGKNTENGCVWGTRRAGGPENPGTPTQMVCSRFERSAELNPDVFAAIIGDLLTSYNAVAGEIERLANTD